ncbi:MAG: DUF2905 domain-containing protein [Candidatus Omnitrophica bacterium]|nr:DUF2905 domain-containing protein [Candidatus Omnitrophota bacterium]
MGDMAKWLILAGMVIMVAGVVLFLVSRIPGAGRLPGDIFIQKDNFSFYFPVVTCIIVSIILSILINFWLKK